MVGPTSRPEPEIRPRGPHRRRGLSAAIVAVVAGVLAVTLFTSFPGRDSDTRAATRDRPQAPAAGAPRAGRASRSPSVVVALAPGASSTPVPPSFLGLSTESFSLPVYVHHMAAFGRVLSLLKVSGDGPLILRVGGNSADHAIWSSRVRTMPDWVFELTPGWLQAARTVVRRAGVRLIVDLNLITDSPSAAADWALYSWEKPIAAVAATMEMTMPASSHSPDMPDATAAKTRSSGIRAFIGLPILTPE